MGSLLGSPTLGDKLCMPGTAGSEGHGGVQGPDHSYAPLRSHPAYSSEWWYWDSKSHPIVPETFLSIPALNFSISILSHLRYNLNFKLSCPK